MKPRRMQWHELADPTEQQIARLAIIASTDCWHGGVRALTLAKRMPCKMRDHFGRFVGGHWTLDKETAKSVVSSVYTSNDGTSRQYMAFACPECGNARLGIDAAYACCSNREGFKVAR